MPHTGSVLPLAWSLGAYFILQILLNLSLRRIARDSPNLRQRVLNAAFRNSVVNALFFMLLAAYLLLSGAVPRPVLPQLLWLWLLGSLPAGAVLWAMRIRLLGVGNRPFGGSSFVLPAEALLRNPSDLGQLNRAALQISLLEPLGHELFFRACMLPLLIQTHGIWPAILATGIVELLLRLNPVWAPGVLLGSLLLSWITIASGSPLPAISIALVAGFLHAYVTAYQSLRSTEKPPAAG